MADRTTRELTFLDSLSAGERPVADHVLNMEGGNHATAYLAIELHRLTAAIEKRDRPWWRVPAQFLGVAVASAFTAVMSWKGMR